MISPDKKGFTIIELIVVIAIIAVLAGIVIANVAKYSVSARNSAIKASMSSMIVAATPYFEVNSSLHGLDFLGTTAYLNAKAAVLASNGNMTITSNGSNANQDWCVCSVLNTTTADPAGSTFCVDSRGIKKQQSALTCANECTGAYACQ